DPAALHEGEGGGRPQIDSEVVGEESVDPVEQHRSAPTLWIKATTWPWMKTKNGIQFPDEAAPAGSEVSRQIHDMQRNAWGTRRDAPTLPHRSDRILPPRRAVREETLGCRGDARAAA